MGFCKKYFFVLMMQCITINCISQIVKDQLVQDFNHPPESAKPWVFWYWMQGAVSKEGIIADLEAMKSVGIAGAYLMPIKDTSAAVSFKNSVRQLTPEWWSMMRFAMQEADRLGLQIAMHASDGFALAGGPWITPAMSMQKVVYSKTFSEGGKQINLNLPQPPTEEGFYKDIAVYAYPVQAEEIISTKTVIPVITTSNNLPADFLIKENAKGSFKSDTACWIQYSFDKPFTCRSIIIKSNSNYQAQRLIIQSSDDGQQFQLVKQLEPPRHGWQDIDAPVTYSIRATTAKYFRFVYDKKGSEPGAEDLDAAKWKPTLKVSGIELSSEAFINQYESKTGLVWRISKPNSQDELPAAVFIDQKKMIDITSFLKDGKLNWNAPAGNWTIIRMGHTSTGHKNETGGGGKGLECDKFNAQAITLQFNSWFGKAIQEAGPDLAKKVLKTFHVDSWECGSQNWSDNFPAEFKKRRGYDLMPYLPVMAGLPIDNINFSEKVLHDVRETIAELINDIFYKTMAKLAHENGCIFTAESVAPTMMSDGMLHYSNVDVPMGEFWLNSPTHDKPNDMLDAISGAHIYGKNIVQAEGFTTVRMDWSEHPGMLKTLGDLNFALGINRMVLHVFTHNPWMNKKPGMTLDGVGLYYQRDQTWFKQSKAWIEYLTRCQTLLQFGKPVVDIAVYTGDEVPRRAVLPDRLVSTLPGIFGKEKVAAEKKRLANEGQPLHTIPDGVTSSANMTTPQDWIDPLHGYAYDSFNPDALMKAKVKDKKIVLPSGASYSLLVIPDGIKNTSVVLQNKIAQLKKEGAIIIGKTDKNSFEDFGIAKDFTAIENGSFADGIAWNHRTGNGIDIYFISNQQNKSRYLNISLRETGRLPELWDAVTGRISELYDWDFEKGGTEISTMLDKNQSIFIVLRKPIKSSDSLLIPFVKGYRDFDYPTLKSSWDVIFSVNNGGPSTNITFDSLQDWSVNQDPKIKYYSGTAQYKNSFILNEESPKYLWLELNEINNIATVKVNGITCGTVWTAPFRVDISKAVKTGKNELIIEVTNTWANRLIGDHLLPEKERITFTTAPYRLEGKPLLKAGLIGPVLLRFEN